MAGGIPPYPQPVLHTWSSSLNRDYVPGSVIEEEPFTMNGVPFPVHIPFPPCAGNLSHINPNEAFCISVEGNFPPNNSQPKVAEILSIRAFVEDQELVFDHNGDGQFDYGSFLKLRVSDPMASYGRPEISYIQKSWANRSRTGKFVYNYISK